MDIAQRVKEVVSRQLNVRLENIKEDSDFVNDLGADSMASIELVAAFESEFDIEMDEDEALQVKNVGEAVKYIENVIKEQQA
ncbi:acyl carrier protein [candidate division KSB1 bacterium 4484_87]|nr:MAG: acyl carrier protein [candidate division KSB1 bacterium 4484_87]